MPHADAQASTVWDDFYSDRRGHEDNQVDQLPEIYMADPKDIVETLARQN